MITLLILYGLYMSASIRLLQAYEREMKGLIEVTDWSTFVEFKLKPIMFGPAIYTYEWILFEKKKLLDKFF